MPSSDEAVERRRLRLRERNRASIFGRGANTTTVRYLGDKWPTMTTALSSVGQYEGPYESGRPGIEPLKSSWTFSEAARQFMDKYPYDPKDPEDPNRDKACEDNSDPIPCDGAIHERTFGPAQPDWPDDDKELSPSDEKNKGDYKITPHQRRYKTRSLGVGMIVQKVRGESSWPSSTDDIRADTRSSYGPGTDQEILQKWQREVAYQGVRSDSSLSAAVQKWMNSIHCETRTKFNVCKPVPEIVDGPKGGGGYKEPDGSGGYYVSDVIAMSGGSSTGDVGLAVCIRASFRCTPAYTLTVWVGAGPPGVPVTITIFGVWPDGTIVDPKEAWHSARTQSDQSDSVSIGTQEAESCSCCEECAEGTQAVDWAARTAFAAGGDAFWASSSMYDQLGRSQPTKPIRRAFAEVLSG